MTPKKKTTAPSARRKVVSFDEGRDSFRGDGARKVAGTYKQDAHPEAAVAALAIWSSLARLEAAWPRLSPAKRRDGLCAYAALRFRRRFGLPWRPEWKRWAAPTQPKRRKRGRPLDARALLVTTLDHDEVLRWPTARYDEGRDALVEILSDEDVDRILARGLLEQRGGRRGELVLRRRSTGSSRFLSIAEYAWISLLCENWPRTRCGPRALIATERAAMKQAVHRYGQRPMTFARTDDQGRQKIDGRGERLWSRPLVQRGKLTR